MTSSENRVLQCDVDGGCRYLDELSKLERLVGRHATAKFYRRMAERCAQQGCWALLLHLNEVALQPTGKGPVSKRRSAEILALVRSDVADVASDDAGNFVERRMQKIDALNPTEPLGYLYDYWRWLRSMTRCQLSNIDTMHLMRSGIVGNLHVVNVESSDPDDFRFELAGYHVPLPPCEKPRSFQVPVYAASVLRDYNTARLTAAPTLQRVRSCLGTTFHHYTRLILPLFDSHRRVSRLLVGIRPERDNATVVGRRR